MRVTALGITVCILFLSPIVHAGYHDPGDACRINSNPNRLIIFGVTDPATNTRYHVPYHWHVDPALKRGNHWHETEPWVQEEVCRIYNQHKRGLRFCGDMLPIVVGCGFSYIPGIIQACAYVVSATIHVLDFKCTP